MEMNRIIAAGEPVTVPEERPFVLGMLSFPIQDWGSVYDDPVALSRGTLFPVLDLPFVGRKDKV